LYEGAEFTRELIEITVRPIFKKNDETLPSNYRPISLVNTVVKLFTILLANRLILWSKRNKVISDYQGAYRPGGGCADHVFVLNSAIQITNTRGENGQKLYALFIDMTAAFDNVKHKLLCETLYKKGISTKFINIVSKIYAKANARIRTNTALSNIFNIGKGVLQGETLSPILFTLYLEDMVKLLESSNTMPIRVGKATIHSLLYADDIVILAYSQSELQRKINIISKFFDELGLKVNLTKTKCMIFWKRHSKERLILTWNGKKIDRVREYIYLGVPFSEVPNFKAALVHFKNKAKVAISNITGLIYTSKMNSFSSMVSLYNSMVRSILNYCSPIWGLSYYEDIEKLRLNFIRKIFSLPTAAPSWFLRLELSNHVNSEIEYVKLLVKFWLRIIHKDNDSLVFKCYEAYKNRKDKLNWLNQFKKVLKRFKLEKLIETEGRARLAEQLRQLKQGIAIAISDGQSKDIVRMQQSKEFYADYRKTKIYCRPESYLDEDLPWQMKKLILQLKLGISHLAYRNKTVRLNLLCYKYKLRNDSRCECCGNIEESTYHIMFECPHYLAPRNKYLKSFIKLDKCKTNYLELFLNPSKEQVLNIFYFFSSALQIRDFTLGN
jgi:hypothetical protein